MEQLSSNRYEIRSEATRRLWQMGATIEPVLVELAASADPETRQRIDSIREKFELDITPDTPPEVHRSLMVAVKGSAKARKKAITWLAAGGHFKALNGLLGKINSKIELQQFYAAITGGLRTSDQSEDLHRFIDALVRTAADQVDARVAVNLLRSVLYQPALQRRSDSAALVIHLVDIAASSRTPEARTTIADAVYRHLHSTKSMENPELLIRWINLVATLDDSRTKQGYLNLAIGKDNLTRVAQREPLAEIHDKLTPAGKSLLLQAVVADAGAIGQAQNYLGGEQLFELVLRIDDPIKRGDCLGRLAGSASWAQATENKHTIDELLSRIEGVKARQAMYCGLLEAWADLSPAQKLKISSDTVTTVWSGLHTADEKVWQLRPLLRTYRLPHLFAQYDTPQLVDRVFRLAMKADDDSLAEFSVAARDHVFSRSLAKHKRVLDYFAAVREANRDSGRSGYWSSLMTRVVTDTLATPELRESFIDFVEDENSLVAKRYLVQGLLSNQSFYERLLDDGHFRRIDAMINKHHDDFASVALRGKLLAHTATIQHLSQSKQVDLLLAFRDQALSQSARDTLLQSILSSDRAVSAIDDAGYFDEVTIGIGDARESIRLRLRQELVGRKAFAKRVVSRGETTQLVKQLTKNGGWVRYGLHSRLAKNLEGLDLSKEPDIAITFWNCAADLETEYDRRTVISALLSSKWFRSQLADQGRLESAFIELSQLLETSSRQYVLSGLIRGPQFVDYLNHGHASIILDACSDLPPTLRDSVFLRLASNHSFRQWIQGNESSTKLMRVMNNVTDHGVRESFARAIVRSIQPILHGASKSGDTVDRWITDLTAFAATQPAPAAKRLRLLLLEQFGHHDAAIGPLLRGDNLSQVLRDIDTLKLDRQQAMRRKLMQSRAFAARINQAAIVGEVFRRYALADDWSKYGIDRTFIRNLKDLDTSGEPDLVISLARYAAKIRSNSERDSFVSALMEVDSLGLAVLTPRNLRLLVSTFRNDEAGNAQTLFGSLTRTKAFEAWFLADGQPAATIRLINQFENANVRSKFAGAVIKSPTFCKQPNDSPFVTEMIGFVQGQGTAAAAELTMDLLAQVNSREPTIQSPLIDRLMTRISDLDHENSELIVRLAEDINAVSALKRLGHGRTIVEAILSVRDPDLQRKCSLSSLVNGNVMTALRDEELELCFDRLGGASASASDLSRIIGSSSVDRLVALGHFETLHQHAQKLSEGKNYEQDLAFRFYRNRLVAQQMRQRNEKATFFESMLSGHQTHALFSNAMILIQSPHAVRWYLDGYGWNGLKRHIERNEPRYRDTLYQIVRISDGVLEYLLGEGDLSPIIGIKRTRPVISRYTTYYRALSNSERADSLRFPRIAEQIAELARLDSNPVNHHDFLQHITTSPFVLRAIAKYDRVPWLVDLVVHLAPEREHPSYFRQLCEGPDSLLTWLIRDGNLDAAGDLLERCAIDDASLRRLSAFLINTGQIQHRTDELIQMMQNGQKQFTADDRTIRRLLFFARASGQTPEALRIAEEIGDPKLLSHLVREQRDWSKLDEQDIGRRALMNADGLSDLSVDDARRLGIGLFLSVILGDAESTSQAATRLHNWSSEDPAEFAGLRTAADALLISGYDSMAFRLLERHLPKRVFYWYWATQQYDRALSAIQWSPSHADACFDFLASNAKEYDQQQQTAVAYMLQVCKLLREIGRNEDLKQLHAALLRIPERNRFDRTTRARYYEDLAVIAYANGEKSLAWESTARTLGTNETPQKVYLRIYRDDAFDNAGPEAIVWWRTFSTRNFDDTFQQRLARVDDVMTLQTPVERLFPLHDLVGDDGTKTALASVSITRRRYQLAGMLNEDQSHAILDAHSKSRKLARTALAREDFAAAANHFRQSWTLRHGDLLSLYMAGHCSHLVGQDTDAQKRKITARCLAFATSQATKLAEDLIDEGLTKDAADLFLTIRRTAGPGSLLYAESLWHESALIPDPEVALSMLQEYVMLHLQRSLKFNRPADSIRIATRMHRLQAEAEIEKGDYLGAESWWSATPQIQLADPSFAQWLIAALRDAGENSIADRVLRRQKEHLEKLIAEYPDSVFLKEQLHRIVENGQSRAALKHSDAQ